MGTSPLPVLRQGKAEKKEGKNKTFAKEQKKTKQNKTKQNQKNQTNKQRKTKRKEEKYRLEKVSNP